MKRAALWALPIAPLACHSAPIPSPEDLPPVEVTQYCEQSRILVGTTTRCHIVLEHEEELSPHVGTADIRIEGLSIKETGQGPDTSIPGRRQQHDWLEIEVERAGIYELPSVSVSYLDKTDEKREAKSERVFLAGVNEVPGSEDDLRDLRIQGPPETPLWMWIASLSAGLAIVVLALFLVLWRRHRGTHSEEPSPEERIRLELDALAAMNLDSLEARRRFCFRITASMRSYLETLCDINASDLTTPEITSALGRTWLPRELCAEFVQVLRAADRVKFAGEPGDRDELLRLHRLSARFVDRALRDPPSAATPEKASL
ncbi:MAG: hypothetical protein AAFP04_09775 [Myxococcota bacterium]